MQGWYYDPKHGHTLRRIVPYGASGTRYLVHGVYGDDEAPLTHGYWSAIVQKDGTKLLVDFAGKPAKAQRYLTAEYHADAREIRWCDGAVQYLVQHPRR